MLHLSEFCYYSLQTEGILGIFILYCYVIFARWNSILHQPPHPRPPPPPKNKNKKLADLDTGTVLGMFSTILRI